MSEGAKRSEYHRYAEACLAMAQIAPTREQRLIQREMAAEFFKLADALPERRANGDGGRHAPIE